MTMSIIKPNALGDGTLTRASTGTVIGSNGQIQTAGVDVPRLNYDPANLTTAPQLLVESAATNSMIWSKGFVANWTNNGTTGWTDNVGVAPDGTTTTTLATAGGTRLRIVTAPANSTACYSVFYKKTVGASVQVYMDGAGLASPGPAFTLNLGTLAISGLIGARAVTYGVQDFGLFVRVFCTWTTSGVGGVTGAHIFPSAGSASFECWGAQLEFGVLAPSSYIATTGAAVTRAADVVSATGLIYSDAPETDFAAWVAATAYSVGVKAIRTSTHRIYQRLVAGTTATAPELDAINWLDIAPTNRWAMFDDKVGTVTSLAGNLTAVMRPGAVSGLALLEMTGRKVTVLMKDAPGGVTVYSKTVSLDATLITSVYDWFYKDYEQMTDLVLTDLPSQFVSNELTITISSTTTTSVGVCKFGELTNVGQTQYGASVGITDYSRKDVDAFGNVLITKRAFSKRADFSIVTEAADFAALFRKFTAIRATPCIFIGTEAAGFDPLIVYGFYKDFSIVVPYPSNHLCNVSIEGLI